MASPHLITVGDNVVDCYQALATMYPGGNCVNVAVFARRFGLESAYVGAVGDDVAGNLIATSLDEEGVGTSLLRTVPGGKTAWCLIGHREGDRIFLGSDLGVSEFSPKQADLAAIARADAVHIGASSHMDDWVEELSSRTRVSYDFSTYGDRQRIAAVAPRLWLATVSGGGLTDTEVVDLAGAITGAGAAWVLVTRGAAGAVLFHGSRQWLVAATPTNVVDTLGSGDTFLARVLTGLLRHEDPPVFLAAAAEAAAATCGTVSAFGHPAPNTITATQHSSH
ncbi:PfkB family carbohydrate kinase [Corynebacterium glyciniphilum]|uniref:PfkB family carbohydrate kinase n=1 Tax=Corynebacterium glyciniphilum TaxID=1404244 RepID=UPI003DA05237